MSKRRAHRKSRGGCAECKRRHIKCDEDKPECSHCVRHEMTCIYRQISRAVRDTSSAEHVSPQSDSSWHFIGSSDFAHVSSNVASTTGSMAKDLFEMSDMALLHHWITVAGHSILGLHDIDHIWHSIMPLIGFKHQYVIHGVLSISALHMAYTNPPDRRKFLLVAAQHRSRALEGFTEDLLNVGPENSTALFANATLTFLYAFTSFSTMFDEMQLDQKTRTTRILGAEWIPLVRGTGAVLEPCYEYVRKGPLSPCLELYKFTDLDPIAEVHASPYIDRLAQIQEIWVADEHAEIYTETLRSLRKCSAWMAQFGHINADIEPSWGYNRFHSGPFIWLFNAPEKYLVLQQQRQPFALIIFAYYGVMLHQLDSYWWAEGCGKSIVGAVDECLGPYWSSWIEWPKQAVGLQI